MWMIGFGSKYLVDFRQRGRFENEIDFLKNRKRGFVLLLERTGYSRSSSFDTGHEGGGGCKYSRNRRRRQYAAML